MSEMLATTKHNSDGQCTMDCSWRVIPSQTPRPTHISIYLCTQLKVAHKNSYFSTGQYKYQRHEEQHAKDVVRLVQPDTIEKG